MAKKKILLVDDDLVLLKFLASFLENEGHEVTAAEDGLSALNILASFVPDVIFVDLILPKIGGQDLCRIIRSLEHLRDCYLVVVSAAFPELDFDYKSVGVDSCIAKNNLAVMAEHVNTCLSESELPRTEDRPITIMGVDGVTSRRMTRELLAQKHHLEGLLESMAEAILEVYSHRVIFANTAAVKILGMPKERILGSSPVDLFAEEIRPRIAALLASSDQQTAEIGRRSPLELNGCPVVIKALPVEAAASNILVITDIGEQKKMEERLIRAQKLEAVGTLAGGIAHDFNNLLTGILGTASLALFEMDPASKFYKGLKTIEWCAESGSRLTRQLLSFAKGGKRAATVCDLNQLAETAAAMFEGSRKTTRIIRSLAPKLGLTEVDKGQIEQVLINLFLNAWQAMGEKGDIHLKTETLLVEQEQARALEMDPGGYVRVAVTDTGCGVAEEHRGRIFDPFYTTRETGRGTGLGLAAAFGIIRNHGGAINLESKPGAGSTFHFFLPVVGSTSPPQTSAIRPQQQGLRGTETVLLVDDEDYVLVVGQQILSELGYKVHVARGGKQGIEVYSSRGHEIDLVVLDMIMPEIDGREVLKEIMGTNPEAKVLLASGYTLDKQVALMLECGCRGFIDKPFNLEKLSRKVREVLDQ